MKTLYLFVFLGFFLGASGLSVVQAEEVSGCGESGEDCQTCVSDAPGPKEVATDDETSGDGSGEDSDTTQGQ